MPTKVIVSGFLIVVLVAAVVLMVEFFIPLSVKADMNTLCRNTLLKMETYGGLSADDLLELETELKDRGLEAVSISGTPYAKKGEELRLDVAADFRYSKLMELFARAAAVQHMDYERVSMSRRVVN